MVERNSAESGFISSSIGADCYNPANPTRLLSEAVVERLLDLLGSDDAYRELFARDPAEALRQIGASPVEIENCAPCIRVERLADKSAICETRALLISQLKPP